MVSLLYYYRKVLKQDLLTKFNYTNSSQIPCLQNVVVNFQVSDSSLKDILPLLSALFFTSLQKPSFLRLKNPNSNLKLRKGVPVGCKVTLRGEAMYRFLEYFLFQIVPQLKSSRKPVFRIGERNVFFTIENHLVLFKEFEKEYENFQRLPNLNVTLNLNTKKKREVVCLLSGLKFPIQGKEGNRKKND